MSRSTSVFTTFAITLLALFASSVLASGTAVTVTQTTSINGTYATHAPTPTATSTQNPSTPSSLVSGSSILDPLSQISMLAAATIFGTFAFGL